MAQIRLLLVGLFAVCALIDPALAQNTEPALPQFGGPGMPPLPQLPPPPGPPPATNPDQQQPSESDGPPAAQPAQQGAAPQEAPRPEQAPQQQEQGAAPIAAPAPAAVPPASGGDIVGGFINGVFELIGVVVLVVLALVALANGANILRFLYGLSPHPAADEINGVIHYGRPYDPDRLARDLAVRPGNAIEREVRSRQARELMESLNAHLRKTRAKLEEETEFLKGQAELAEGMEMHERIKRRLDAVLRAQGKLA